MNENDHKRLLNFYEDAYLLYGDGTRSVHWSNEQTQSIRFEVLSSIGDLHKKKVLDVGSGLGDMYRFFLKKGTEVDYTGVDIVPIFIERSRSRFPEATFMHGSADELTGWYDYVLVSGSFNFTIENAQSYYFNLIKTIFNHTRIGFAFNMLNRKSHQSDDTYIAYDAEEVVTFCKSLTPHVVLVEGYLPWDFTIYMYKDILLK